MCNQSGTSVSCEFTAYVGDGFTVEWFFDERHSSQPFEYYEKLSAKERARVLGLFKRIGDVGELKDKSKFNYEGDQVYAFKPKPDRFLCFFFKGKKIIVTNAFRKKCKKLPGKEKVKALACKKSYIQRVNSGDYYE